METIYFSLGHRCTSAHLLKDCNLKVESHPFDWIVSKLETVQHCILDEFKEFLNISNYKRVSTKVLNNIDNENIKADNDFDIFVNSYYEKNIDNDIFNTFGLANYHYDYIFKENMEYYLRCITRFQNVLSTDTNKIFLYIHPIIGIKDYNTNYQDILKSFINFKKFIDTKTTNLIGIYFIIVKTDTSDRHYDRFIDMDVKLKCYTIYTNNGFLDSSTPFAGNFINEYELMKKLFLSNIN